MFYLLLLHTLASIALLVIGVINLTIPKGRDSLHSRLGNVYFWLSFLLFSDRSSSCGPFASG